MKVKTLFAGVLAGAGLACYLYNRSRAHKAPLDPVHPFDPDKFLGKWYEVARIDNCFERNLSNTSAHYARNPNGTIQVVNKGYNTMTHEHREATGTARFTGPKDIGSLEVSFWGPFYSGLTVIAIDKNYKHALMAGRNLDYLWILSRDTTIPDKLIEHFLEVAAGLGYDVDKIIRIEHDHVVDRGNESVITKTIQQIFPPRS